MYFLLFSKLQNTFSWNQKLILKTTECVLIYSISSRKSSCYIKVGYSLVQIALFNIFKYIVSCLKNDRHEYYSSFTHICNINSDSFDKRINIEYYFILRHQTFMEICAVLCIKFYPILTEKAILLIHYKKR